MITRGTQKWVPRFFWTSTFVPRAKVRTFNGSTASSTFYDPLLEEIPGPLEVDGG